MALRDLYLVLSDTDSQQLEYDGSGYTIYIGNAQPGTATSATGWRIKRLTNNANGQPTAIQFASGSPAYNFIWDNRSQYVYS